MMNPPNIILALASKQIWPHVLTLTRYRPKRLILLHSEEGEESQEPARRLQALVTRGGNLGVADVSLEKISYDNFDAVKQRLDILFAEKQLSRETTAINFTGGNKLMAAAAFEWAKENGVPAFYLERGNRLFQFHFEGHRTLAEPAEILDPSETNSIDAIELLTCQLGPGALQSRGERLRLNEKGTHVALGEITAQLRTRLIAKHLISVSGSILTMTKYVRHAPATTWNTALPS